MACSFHEFVQLAAEHASADLVGEADRHVLARWAARSTPVLWGGLEIPLGEHSWVDAHQGIAFADRRRLLAAVHSGASSFDEPLRALCRRWNEAGSLLERAITNIILEYDLRGPGDQQVAPFVFAALPFEEPAADAVTGTLRRTAVHEVLACLAPETPAALFDGLDRCFDACPPEALVSHVGVPAGRTDRAVRINVKRLRHDAHTAFLQRLGWNGSFVELDRLLLDAAAFSDRTTLALDVTTDGPGPLIGLECAVTGAAGFTGWERLLGQLVTHGLCTPSKHRGVRDWPGQCIPARCRWPDALMLDALLHEPPTAHAVVDRYVSHVKLTLSGCVRSAKVYLGFRYGYRDGAADEGAVKAKASTRRATAAPDSARSAMVAATDFLLTQRLQGGWWEDYSQNGRSDEWVTAYVGAVLAASPNPNAVAAARWAFRLLCARRPGESGWSFGAQAPPDADSTAWTLRLAQRIGRTDDPRCERARKWLTSLVREDGGVCTYPASADVRRFAYGGGPGSVAGWCDASACVTAAATAVLADATTTRRYLRRTQHSDGHWEGYWWFDDEYATVLAVRALAEADDPQDGARIRAAERWAASRTIEGAVRSAVDGAPSAFCAALCMALLPNDTLEHQYLLSWLLDEQLADGSWKASAWLRIPPPEWCAAESSDAGGAVIRALDRNAVFTTATVLRALQAAGG